MSLAEETLLHELATYITTVQFEREHRFHESRRWRFDFALPEHKIAIEIDGFGRHQQYSGFCKDLEKVNAATKLGWAILRYPAKMVTDSPRFVVDDICEYLEIRGLVGNEE